MICSKALAENLSHRKFWKTESDFKNVRNVVGLTKMLGGQILRILIEIFPSLKTKGASTIPTISFDAKFERWLNDNLRERKKISVKRC